jgi:hypothetical protein
MQLSPAVHASCGCPPAVQLVKTMARMLQLLRLLDVHTILQWFVDRWHLS